MIYTVNDKRGDHTAISIDFDPTVQRMEGIARHGDTQFDTTFISEITDGLWQGGCANGLVLPSFITNIVSLYPWEQYTVHHELHSMLSVRMYDSEEQMFHQVDGIAKWVRIARTTGITLIHCQAGLNRSSLIAARVLMLDGLTADEAIALIREKRSPACLCNKSFERWLRQNPTPQTEENSK